MIAAEVRDLAPVLLAPEDLGTARFEPASAPLHTLVKRQGGREFLLAVNAGAEPCEVTFDLRHELPTEARVLPDNTTVKTAGTRLRARFAPLEARVYDLGAVAKGARP